MRTVFPRRLQPWLLALLFSAVYACGGLAWAAVTLSVRVVHGGLDVDFGTVSAGEPSRTEEVELTLTSTGGGQYRVYQELPGLLINERGDHLPEGRLVMQISKGLTGMTRTGGILAVTETSQELFVSNVSGLSDTLLLAYSVSPGTPIPSGTYRGVLRFTVESLSTKAIVTQTLNVRATISTTLSMEPALGSPTRVIFDETEPGKSTTAQELLLTIRNNTASASTITHELIEPLTNVKSDRLATEMLTFHVSSTQGTLGPRPATITPDVIVTDPRGDVQTMRLTYTASIPTDQPAGTYRGTARLHLTSVGTSTAAELRVPIEVRVSEVFTMSVKSTDGAAALHFGRTVPSEGPVERTMLVEIRTNMGRPYQVLAGLDHPLVLETGETLPSQSLVWSVLKPGHGNGLVAPDAPVAVGYQPLYQSDAKGSPDTFVLSYRLAVPADAKDGLYSGQLRFTITLF